MPLTKSQHRVLTAYRRRREQGGPTLASYFGPLYLWPLAALLPVIALLVGIGFFVNWFLPLATLVAGFIAGRVAADLRYYRQSRAHWPFASQLIDWRRVDELLDQVSPR